ncbi:MAG: hypothetical protein DRP73_05610, partial [Candidatus Omnitrophota bacterium]
MNIEQLFSNWELLHRILSCLERKERVWIRGIGGTPLSFLIFSLSRYLHSKIIAVADKEEVSIIYPNLSEFLHRNVILYGEDINSQQGKIASLH